MPQREAVLVEGTPRSRAPRTHARRLYAALVSPKLAIALLVTVLVCCVVGVTVVREARAWELIFSTLWFNLLLTLLALSSGAAFFTRIWRRKLTLLSAGMILFHLSFVALLGGAVVNGLFRFKGVLRLSEGETLPLGELASYDSTEGGRLFDLSRLGGEATLLRVHPQHRVDGQRRGPAFELEVGRGGSRTTGTVYMTHALEHDGVRYLTLKEGYSILISLVEPDGRESYAAVVPLQAHVAPDGSHAFVTGTATEAKSFFFPPESPRVELLVALRPSTIDGRAGEVHFQAVPLGAGQGPAPERSGTVLVGGQFDAGAFRLAPKELRYWVGMDVRYDPGLGVILTSLTVGLAGMVLIFVGRHRQGARRGADEGMVGG